MAEGNLHSAQPDGPQAAGQGGAPGGPAAPLDAAQLEARPPESPAPAGPPAAPPRWQPLCAIDRRVLGVLAEKAKTTPDVYPLTLNALRTGCNQKSNRAPIMALEADEVEESLERLRRLGAVGVIHGHGRVTKYRHYLYDWLGVDKVELAVMTELLLRGAQTEGELRGRAARMEPIRDLAELRPILDRLKAKGLVLALTPEGRGHVVTHALYEPRELEALKAQFGAGRGPATRAAAALPPPLGAPPGAGQAAPSAPSAPVRPAGEAVVSPAGYRLPEAELIPRIRQQIDELRTELKQLQSQVEEIADRQQQTDNELRRLKDALGE